MAKKHEWQRVGTAHIKCKVCGASRWGKPGGWGRAMKNGKPTKYCEGRQKTNRPDREAIFSVTFHIP